MGEKQTIKGFKVFNPEWVCRNKEYTCPGRFREEGELEVCGHGMHFCLNAVDCFKYYEFDQNNHVAEIIAHGKVVYDDDKCCTDDIEIVREIQWDEVLRIVNTGKNCTGLCNTGDRNTGNRNTGDYNTGNWNTGDYNTGNRNTGNRNTGNYNTGNRNTGNRNTGDYNTGDYNTGNRNTGDWNTGEYNTGDCNTGEYNTGDCNTGNRNTGNWNTGDYNTSSFNTGCFNTKERSIFLFDKSSDWSYKDWLYSEAQHLLNQMQKNVVEWISPDDMTDEEKAAYPTYETTGGYLKVLDESECSQIWWEGLNEKQKEVIRGIPNFNKEIFEQITGIRTE